MNLAILHTVASIFSIAGAIAAIAAAIKASGFHRGARDTFDKITKHQSIVTHAAVVKDLEELQNIVQMFAPGCTNRAIQGIDFDDLNNRVRILYAKIDTQCREKRIRQSGDDDSFVRFEESLSTFCMTTNSEQRIQHGKSLYTNIRDLLVSVKQRLDAIPAPS